MVMRSGTGKNRPVPEPTQRFRHQAWRAFQKALDPLAPPRRLPTEKRQ
jgi:hypothetical protein